MERSKVVDCLIVVSKFLIGSTDSIMALIHFYTQGGVAVSSQHVAGFAPTWWLQITSPVAATVSQ